MNFIFYIKDFFRVIFHILYPVLKLYSYFVIIGLICLEVHKFNSWTTILVFFFYHLISTLIVIYYMKLIINEGCSTKEIFPHVPTENKKVKLKGINVFIQQEIIKHSVIQVKTCGICKTFKPPRAHHCKICNRCYLKYDHHCFFLDVCIGFHNYKYLFQFICANIIQSFYFIITISVQFNNPISTSIIVNNIIALSLELILLIIMIFMLSFHIYLITNNETTVEHEALNKYINGNTRFSEIFQEGPITQLSENKDRTILNPYNISPLENWKQVFGNNIIDWIKPDISSYGDGTSFIKNYKDYDMI